MNADSATVKVHYPENDVWFAKVGQRTLTNYAKKGLDVKKVFGTDDAVAIGKTVKQWLITYFQESPVLVAAVEGYETIEIVRKISGNTIPILAVSGTVRGDFSHDTIDLANEQNRPLRNLIHASDAVEDGEKEVALWFKPEELFPISGQMKISCFLVLFPPRVGARGKLRRVYTRQGESRLKFQICDYRLDPGLRRDDASIR